jgi:anti-sigma B factor antagonist
MILPMDIQEEKKGAVMVLRPMGPLVQADVDQFKSRLKKLRIDSMGRIVVDISSVAYVDSTGLEALVEANEELSQAGQILKLCGVNETVREVLGLTDLDGLFEHFDDVTSAVRSFL